jgi:hypothetical protein
MKCLQRGADWGFKLSSLRFVFKGSFYRIIILESSYFHSTFPKASQASSPIELSGIFEAVTSVEPDEAKIL